MRSRRPTNRPRAIAIAASTSVPGPLWLALLLAPLALLLLGLAR